MAYLARSWSLMDYCLREILHLAGLNCWIWKEYTDVLLQVEKGALRILWMHVYGAGITGER